MARGDFDNFVNWAGEHGLDYESPDVQDVYYSWIEIFSSTPSASNPESLDAFVAFLELSGYDADEIEDILDMYTED